MVVIAQTGVGVIVNLVDGPWFLGSDKCISFAVLPMSAFLIARFHLYSLRKYVAETVPC